MCTNWSCKPNAVNLKFHAQTRLTTEGNYLNNFQSRMRYVKNLTMEHCKLLNLSPDYNHILMKFSVNYGKNINTIDTLTRKHEISTRIDKLHFKNQNHLVRLTLKEIDKYTSRKPWRSINTLILRIITNCYKQKFRSRMTRKGVTPPYFPLYLGLFGVKYEIFVQNIQNKGTINWSSWDK